MTGRPVGFCVMESRIYFSGRESCVDPEVFRPIEVGPAVAGQDAPEGQIGHILHRGQGQQGVAAAEQRPEHFRRSHAGMENDES